MATRAAFHELHYRGSTLVECEGNLAERIEELRTCLDRLINDGCINIVLDLDNAGGLTFAVQTVLLDYLKLARAEGGNIHLATYKQENREAVRLSALEASLRVFDDTVSAVASL